MKKFTDLEIYNKYNRLSATKQVLILWDALDVMARGKSDRKSDCICLAMGYRLEYTKLVAFWVKKK